MRLKIFAVAALVMLSAVPAVAQTQGKAHINSAARAALPDPAIVQQQNLQQQNQQIQQGAAQANIQSRQTLQALSERNRQQLQQQQSVSGAASAH